MINIDQVRTLEIKVKQAVQLIVHLRRENDQLRNKLADTEVKLQELENNLHALQTSQGEIEEGIKNAIDYLDDLEDEEEIVPSDFSSQIAPAQESLSDFHFEKEPNLEVEEKHTAQQGLGIF